MNRRASAPGEATAHDVVALRRTRAVRVRTEVAAVDKEFDYTLPEGWADDVVVGTRLRVPLHGRSVRGWVVDEDVSPPEGVEILPAKSWLGWGPPPAVVSLAQWAAWRWAGPASFFLGAASPSTVVRSLPGPPPLPSPDASGSDAPPSDRAAATEAAPRPWADFVGGQPAGMVRLPPAMDLLDVVLSVIDAPTVRSRGGSVVVLVPSAGWAERLQARLNRRGRPSTNRWDEARAGWPVVVGNRVAAWAPVPHLAAAIVLDAHDEAYREESAPTYHAAEVLAERARREGAPCILTSPVPPLALSGPDGLTRGATSLPTRDERAGWPALELVDRRGADPRTGVFSDEFVRLSRSVLDEDDREKRGPLVCVYNRTGGARLLACRHCGELARCTRCGAAAALARHEEVLRCPRCHDTRPVVCAACGRLRMKTLRAGVSRLRDELSALLNIEVTEVSGPGSRPSPSSAIEAPDLEAPVLVGTEAVLHRVRRAAAVAFLDIDLHLLAPRLSATEETLALFVRAGRLVGRRGGGPASSRVQAQTRVPDHPVLAAIALGEPAPVLEHETALRQEAGLPPFSALAVISGTLAPGYADSLVHALGALGIDAPDGTGSSATAVSDLGDGRFSVQAPTHDDLSDLLARVPRPAGRGLRVEVDPTSI